jgi:hypothetical protein
VVNQPASGASKEGKANCWRTHAWWSGGTLKLTGTL